MTLPKLIHAVCCLVVTFGVVCFAQNVEIKKLPIKYVNPSQGREMYMSYCAACHGANGNGAGPAARAFKVPPANLTLLAHHNQGTFPAMHVSTAIWGDSYNGAHGSDMPVWASLFRHAHQTVNSEPDIQMRIYNLTKYVETLQQK